jgi:hypothetical protein
VVEELNKALGTNLHRPELIEREKTPFE